MVTTFNRGDLTSFGNYLLSQERRERFQNHPHAENMPPLEDRLSEVNHADVENWLAKKDGVPLGVDIESAALIHDIIAKVHSHGVTGRVWVSVTPQGYSLWVDSYDRVGAGSLPELMLAVSEDRDYSWMSDTGPVAPRTERLLSAPARHELRDLFAELKFGRPSEEQTYLDGLIAAMPQ